MEGAQITTTFQYIPSTQNTRADALAKMSSKLTKGGRDSMIKTSLREPSIMEKEILPTEEIEDCRTPIYHYLAKNTLPSDKNEARKVSRRSGRFFIRQGALYRKNFIHPSAKCIWRMTPTTC